MTMSSPPTGGPVTVRGMYGEHKVGDITMPIGQTLVTAEWPFIVPAGSLFHLGIMETPARGAGTDITVIVGGAGVQS
jgi:hypothetical protein